MGCRLVRFWLFFWQYRFCQEKFIVCNHRNYCDFVVADYVCLDKKQIPKIKTKIKTKIKLFHEIFKKIIRNLVENLFITFFILLFYAFLCFFMLFYAFLSSMKFLAAIKNPSIKNAPGGKANNKTFG